jgi:hypothetical protein
MTDIPNLTELLGDMGDYALIIDSLASTLNGYSYEFISMKEYRKVLFQDRDFAGASKIYWTEMLNRAHLNACSSILRNQRWINGVINAASQKNFLVFSACYRGLIESASDSYSALSQVPLPLANKFKWIMTALAGESKFLLQDEHLENTLIHFSHARKLEKGERFPLPHKAKDTTYYIKKLQGADHGILLDCYSELCKSLFNKSPTDSF